MRHFVTNASVRRPQGVSGNTGEIRDAPVAGSSSTTECGKGGFRERARACNQALPACLQIRDGRIGGLVEFAGAFTSLHREELLNRIRNVEKQTMEERPMERIIKIKEDRDRIVVSATTEHLVARIGKAVLRDFGGSLDLKYAPEEKFATARWRRD